MEELLGGREGGGGLVGRGWRGETLVCLPPLGVVGVLVWDGEGGLRGGDSGSTIEVSGLCCSYLGRVGTLP